MPRKAHLLLVDDDPNTLASLSRAFRIAGHEVTVCDNVTRAVELLRSEAFDLVFSDVVMPGKDGIAVCQALLVAFTLGSLPFFHSSPEWLVRLCDGTSISAIFLGELGLTALALFVPGLLMGMSLPLLLACVTNEPGRFGHWLGRLHAVNTLGCVVGAFVTGFVFVPWFGIQATFGILAGGTLFVGLIAR